MSNLTIHADVALLQHLVNRVIILISVYGIDFVSSHILGVCLKPHFSIFDCNLWLVVSDIQLQL